MSLKSFFKSTIAILFIASLMTSCDKSTDLSADNINDSITSESPTTSIQNFMTNSRNDDDMDQDSVSSDMECFTINYPLTILFPDGTNQEIGSDDELEALFISLEAEYPDTSEYPSIAFPQDITLADGTVMTINSEEEIDAVFEECGYDDDYDYADDDYDHEGEYGDGHGCDIMDDLEFDCFVFEFPITVILPDNTTIELSNEEELYTAVDNYYDNNPDSEDDPTLQYPVTVVLLADSTSQEIASDDELELLYETCYGFYDDEDICFEFNFPLDIVLPNGDTQAAENLDQLDEIVDAYYIANPDSDEDFTFNYPIEVSLEDGTTQSISSDEELETLFESCDDD